MVDSNKFLLHGPRVLCQNLKGTSIIEDTIFAIQPSLSFGSRSKGFEGVGKNGSVFQNARARGDGSLRSMLPPGILGWTLRIFFVCARHRGWFRSASEVNYKAAAPFGCPYSLILISDSPADWPRQQPSPRMTDIPGCFRLRDGEFGGFRFQGIGSQAAVSLLDLQPDMATVIETMQRLPCSGAGDGFFAAALIAA